MGASISTGCETLPSSSRWLSRPACRVAGGRSGPAAVSQRNLYEWACGEWLARHARAALDSRASRRVARDVSTNVQCTNGLGQLSETKLNAQGADYPWYMEVTGACSTHSAGCAGCASFTGKLSPRASDERHAGGMRHRMSRCGSAAATGAAWRGTNLHNVHQERYKH